MSTYPTAIVSTAQMPTHADGDVIYGSQMNTVQNEAIAIEQTLGLGTALKSDGTTTFATLVDRLTALTNRVKAVETSTASASGVHALASGSDVVGTTDTQTLTNKTLSSPVITGTLGAGGATVSGAVTFSGGVTFQQPVTMSGAPTITDFTHADHDHSDAAQGGNIPESSVTNLVTDLGNKSNVGHKHVAGDITGLAQVAYDGLWSSIQSPPPLGTASPLDVPATVGGTATSTQAVRGDDPRLTDSRTPAKHAPTHASGGSDPVSPASIGASAVGHTHTKSQVTDFQHALSDTTYHSGTLPISMVGNLQSTLDGKLGVNAQAVDSAKVGGIRITPSTTAPGSPNKNDVWIVI